MGIVAIENFNYELTSIEKNLIAEAVQHFNRLARRELSRKTNDFKERYFFDEENAQTVVQRSRNPHLAISPIIEDEKVYCWVVSQQ